MASYHVEHEDVTDEEMGICLGAEEGEMDATWGCKFEEVYSVLPGHQMRGGTWPAMFCDAQMNYVYFQTYGGGPEGGYVVSMLSNKAYHVNRNWGTPWEVTDVYDDKHPADVLIVIRTSSSGQKAIGINITLREIK